LISEIKIFTQLKEIFSGLEFFVDNNLIINHKH
jgi:hypothetical protein